MKSDTPRTDAIEFRHCPPQPDSMLKKHEDAYALSRQLERELTASQAENAKLRELCERVISDLSKWDKGNASAWKYQDELNK
jgi:hypothetical protein